MLSLPPLAARVPFACVVDPLHTTLYEQGMTTPDADPISPTPPPVIDKLQDDAVLLRRRFSVLVEI
jgi:hypothetical protein